MTFLCWQPPSILFEVRRRVFLFFLRGAQIAFLDSLSCFLFLFLFFFSFFPGRFDNLDEVVLRSPAELKVQLSLGDAEAARVLKVCSYRILAGRGLAGNPTAAESKSIKSQKLGFLTDSTALHAWKTEGHFVSLLLFGRYVDVPSRGADVCPWLIDLIGKDA